MPLAPGSDRLNFATKTVTFTGAANLGQAGTNVTVFTVTGEVLIVALVPFCTTLLTEAVAGATVSLGATGAGTLWIATTNSVDIDANEFWVDTTPDANGVALPSASSAPYGLKDIVTTDDVIIVCATQNTNGGVIRFDCYWMPLSPGSSLVAA